MGKQLNIFNLIYRSHFKEEKINLIDEIIHVLSIYNWYFNIEYWFHIRWNILDNLFDFVINSENSDLMNCLIKIISRNKNIKTSKDIKVFWIWFTFNKDWLLIFHKKLFFNYFENSQSLCIIKFNIKNNKESIKFYKKNIFDLSIGINNINYKSNVQFISSDNIFIKLNNILDKEIFFIYNISIELYNLNFWIIFIQMDLKQSKIFIKNSKFPSDFSFYLAI
jgi:hypothetical protein